MKFNLILFLLLFTNLLLAQKQTINCKVLSNKLEGTYDGACKNRLAHGEGTAKGAETYIGEFKEGLPHGTGKYIFKDGSYYTGEFKNGEKHGEGTMYNVNKEGNGIQADKLAKWKNDEFVEYILEKKYKIIQNINTLSITFDKPDEEQERVEIMLGSRSVLSGINVQPSSGNFFMSGNNRAIIENVNFPLRVRMTYNAQKGVGSAVSVRLEFELESKGHWKIIVNSQ